MRKFLYRRIHGPYDDLCMHKVYDILKNIAENWLKYFLEIIL